MLMMSRSRALVVEASAIVTLTVSRAILIFCGAKDDGLNHNEHKYFGETLMIISNYK